MLVNVYNNRTLVRLMIVVLKLYLNTSLNFMGWLLLITNLWLMESMSSRWSFHRYQLYAYMDYDLICLIQAKTGIMVYKFRSLAVQIRKAPHVVAGLKLALIGSYFLSKKLYVKNVYDNQKSYIMRKWVQMILIPIAKQ